MKKITVLTAVYNAEKYLRQCLDSLQNQTLADCEFICIDDCSTDRSLDILKEYASRDDRFIVLQQQSNQGQAMARNEALKHATGEYTAMLDADDWLAPDTLQKAYSILQSTGADTAVLRLIKCYENGEMEEYHIQSDKTQWSGEEAFVLSLDWSLHGLYVVRTSIHQQYPFDTACKLYSDDNTTRTHYLHSNKVILTDAQYFYRQHSESMTTACTIRRFDYMLANLSMRHTLISEIACGSITNADHVLSLYEHHRWLNVVGCYWYYYQHKRQFTSSEQAEICSIFTRILPTIDSSLIPYSLKLKLGYYPFKSYALFSFAENIYFALRKLLGRQ